ncbi:MAG: hypothetical protein MI919_34880, partial [Holophagales bacterium]|nr:hypothetical protein [Holophagales bacterium]
GTLEYGYQEIFDRHRPVLPTVAGLKTLQAVATRGPHLFFDRLDEPLGADRSRLLERLGTHSVRDELLDLRLESYVYSWVGLVRTLAEQDPQLINQYPDYLCSDAERFASWLELFGSAEMLLPPRAVEVFRRTSKGRSLARIYSLMSRHWPMMERYPLALVGIEKDPFVRALLSHSQTSRELDLEDVVMYRWLMDVDPSAGLELTLSLPYNARRLPLRSSRAAQEELLRPATDRDPRLRAALLRLWKDRGLLDQTAGTEPDRPWHVLDPSARPPGRLPARVSRPGVNVFGFFKSPIGLGSMSHGLAQALEHAGVPTSRSVLPHFTMDADITPRDFVDGFDESYGTNLFVGFPHAEEHLLRTQSREIIDGRRNIAYLAWELEEGNALWRRGYEDLDDIWALSSFAARSLETCLERPVRAVPCVLDVESMPPPATKSEVGLDEQRTIFLYAFDPSSSVERKNPRAVVEAFSGAFRPGDRAQLVLRVSNVGSATCRQALRDLGARAAETGLDIRFH